MYLVHDLVDVGKWIGISDGDVIEPLVIDNRSFGSMLLSLEEDRCGSGAASRALCDHACF